jgi:integrase
MPKIVRRAVTVSLPKGVSRITSNGKAYWYYQERRGKPDAGPRLKLPEFGTPEFWAAIAKITGKPPEVPANTIKSLIEDYKAQPRWSKLRPNTQKLYKITLKHIEDGWGHLDPASITVDGVLRLQKSHADRPAMSNMILILARALMKRAVQKKLRIDNPAREIEDLETDPDEAKPLTADAWQAITSDEAPEALRRYAILARATGQRISDVLPMRPADRDEDGISLTITKLHDKPHWCPLLPDEIAAIDGWNVFKNACYLTDEDGRPFTDPTFRKVWKEFQATDAGAALAGFTPHDLRATKVCDERIRGKPHQQIAAMVGLSLPMVMKYSKYIDQRLAARGTASEHDRAKS